MKTLNHIKRAKEVVTTSLNLIGDCNLETFSFLKKKIRSFPQAISAYWFPDIENYFVAIDRYVHSTPLKGCLGYKKLICK